MKQARALYQGAAVEVYLDGSDIRIKGSDEVVAEQELDWQIPVAKPGTIFALGLNYADHASELEFAAPEEPLVFLKGANTLNAHGKNCYRPDDIDFMHYECELVAVIGKQGKNIKREDAMDYIQGYTICNDFAIRDYLENYYRPNLKVKSRDGLCPIGPWLVDKDDIKDVNNLALQTRVNGEVFQTGSTKDMIFDIAFLVEYLSHIMTLKPGDMIATGTPKGLKDMQPGDVVECSIEGLGTLRNNIVSEQDYFAEDY